MDENAVSQPLSERWPFCGPCAVCYAFLHDPNSETPTANAGEHWFPFGIVGG